MLKKLFIAETGAQKESALSADMRLENILLEHKNIKDCYVLERASQGKERTQTVAYVVAKGSVEEEELNEQLERHGMSNIKLSYVRVNCLPLDEKGVVDEAKLMLLPVIDAQRVKQFVESAGVKVEGISVKKEVTPQKWFSGLDVKLIPTSPALASVNLAKNPIFKKSSNLSILHGAPLNENNLSKSLGDLLVTAAEDKGAGITFVAGESPSTFVPYASLLENAEKILAGLQEKGIQNKQVIILNITDERNFLEAFWSCAIGGIIPLLTGPIDNTDPESSAVKKLTAARQSLGNPFILTDSRSRRALDHVLEKSDRILSIESLRKAQTMHSRPAVQKEDTALLLLTSGSTDKHKLVPQTHGALIARSAGSSQMNHFSKQDVFLNWFPLDHVGGIIMSHLQAVSVAASQIQVSMSFILNAPLKWLELIMDYQVTTTWAPNFAFQLVTKALDEQPTTRKWDLSCLKFILNGGEAISASQAQNFMKKLKAYGLSQNAMFPAWGMTETCSGVLFSHQFGSENESTHKIVNLGTPIPGMGCRVVDQGGKVVTQGIPGLLEVKGTSVTKEYYQNEKATKKSFTEDKWFKTGDQAVIEEGTVLLTGRAKDVIIVNGLNYTADEIESSLSNIGNTTAISFREKSDTTDQLVIFLEIEQNSLNEFSSYSDQIRKKILQDFGIQVKIILPIKPSHVPRTNIGKIQRSILKKQFEEGKFNEALDLLKGTPLLRENTFQTSWKKKLLTSVVPEKKTDNYAFCLLNPSLSDTLFDALGQNKPAHILNPEELSDSELQANLSHPKLESLVIVDDWNKGTPKNSGEVSVESFKRLNSTLTRLFQNGHFKRVIYVSRYSQKVQHSDTIDLEKVISISVLKALGEEKQVTIKHVDVDTQTSLKHVAEECFHYQKNAEVAYRNNVRYVKGLERLPIDPLGKSVVKKGGFYVLTGGFGGVGTLLAQRLLKDFEAKILVIGRTQLPERHMWQQYLEDGLPETQKIKALKLLQGIGKGKIIYAAGDISDQSFLENTLEQAKKFMETPVHGVFHLAGHYEEATLEDCDDKHLRSVFSPKITGTWNLYNAFSTETDQPFFVNFSSVNAYFAGPKVSAYSAANAYMEALAQTQKPHSYSYGWSMWDETGMSKGYAAKELTALKGYCIMEQQDALNTLFLLLTQPPQNLLIGIDPTKGYMDNQLFEQQGQYLVEVSISGNFEGPRLDMKDAFGTKVDILLKRESGNNEANSSEEAQDIFHTLSDIWCNVLKLERLPQDANFFDLGGHSLLIMKVQEKILKQLGVEIDVVELFKHPTINELSDFIKRNQVSQIPVEETLHAIWSRILNLQKISSEDNFFDLGGHSLSLIKVREQLLEELGLEIEMIDLFKYPTINSLKNFIRDLNEKQAS